MHDTHPRARNAAAITTGEIVGTILVLIVVVIFSKLCLWQLHRLHDRRASNAGIAARMTEPPIPGAALLSDTSGALYRRIQVSGSFDDERTIILPGRSLNGSPGVHVLTPLRSGNVAVLVNRGWAPSADASTVDLEELHSKPLPVVTGLALPFPDRSASVSQTGDSTVDAGEFRRVWYTIDEKALRSQFPYPLAPFVVQMLPAPGLTGTPHPLAAPALGEGSHLGYAMQWFAFAVIAVVGWTTFILRRRADRRGGRVTIGPPHPPSI